MRIWLLLGCFAVCFAALPAQGGPGNQLGAVFMKPLFTKGHAWAYQVTYTDDSWSHGERTHKGEYICTVTDTMTIPKIAVSRVKCASKSKDIRQDGGWGLEGIFIGKKNGVWLLGSHLVGPARKMSEFAGESTWPPKRAVINSTVRQRPPFYAAGQRRGPVNRSRGKQVAKPDNPYKGPPFVCKVHFNGAWQAKCEDTDKGLGMSYWQATFDPKIGFYRAALYNTDGGYDGHRWEIKYTGAAGRAGR